MHTSLPADFAHDILQIAEPIASRTAEHDLRLVLALVGRERDERLDRKLLVVVRPDRPRPHGCLPSPRSLALLHACDDHLQPAPRARSRLLDELRDFQFQVRDVCPPRRERGRDAGDRARVVRLGEIRFHPVFVLDWHMEVPAVLLHEEFEFTSGNHTIDISCSVLFVVEILPRRLEFLIVARHNSDMVDFIWSEKEQWFSTTRSHEMNYRGPIHTVSPPACPATSSQLCP